MARYYRIRPSALLRGGLVDLNIDVAFGLSAMQDNIREFDQATGEKGLMSAIAAAARVGIKAVP